MKTITIIGAGMMGSALAFPARENGNDVRIVGTHLDREIIEDCKKSNRHTKFTKDFPEQDFKQQLPPSAFKLQLHLQATVSEHLKFSLLEGLGQAASKSLCNINIT